MDPRYIRTVNFSLKKIHLALAFVLIGACALIAPAKAHAATVVDCMVTERLIFTPPVSSTPQGIAATYDDLGACPLPGNPANIVGVETSGIDLLNGVDCPSDTLGSINPRTGTRTLIWSDGTTSLFSYKVTYTGAPLHATYTGTIITGVFSKGGPYTVTLNLTFPGIGFGCTPPSTDKIYGYGNLTISM